MGLATTFLEKGGVLRLEQTSNGAKISPEGKIKNNANSPVIIGRKPSQYRC